MQPHLHTCIASNYVLGIYSESSLLTMSYDPSSDIHSQMHISYVP